MSYQVVLFQTSRGDRVVAEYISNLPHPTYSKYLRLIGLLAEYGPHLSMPYSRKLTKELYELRTKGKNPKNTHQRNCYRQKQTIDINITYTLYF